MGVSDDSDAKGKKVVRAHTTYVRARRMCVHGVFARHILGSRRGIWMLPSPHALHYLHLVQSKLGSGRKSAYAQKGRKLLMMSRLPIYRGALFACVRVH